jgi:ankyrin repeat protein
MRLPQTRVLPPTPSCVSAVPDSAPQFALRDAGDAPRLRLCAAVLDGDATAVKRMLAAGDGNLNTVDPDSGTTVLALAAMHGHGDIVFLLCKGASASDIHREAAVGSALMLAASSSQTDVMELLLGKSATQQDKGRALATAALHGRIYSIELLLAHGASVDHPDAFLDTPLHMAALFGKSAAVQVLLKAGASAACVNARGTTPLMLAAEFGHTDTVKLLAKKADVNLADRDGDTALIKAARRGHFEIVQRLLVKGAHAGKCNARGESALSAAREAGHGKVARFLSLLSESTTAGTMPASSAHQGDEPLLIASDRVVASANAAGSTSTTTAGKTTASTSTSSTSTSSSVAPNAVSPDKIVARPAPTTLLQAVERNDAKALTRLLKELRQTGENLAQAISQLGELESRNDAWLQGKRLTPLMAAAYLGYEPLLRLLITHYADVDQVDSFGRTALICAARSGQTEVVQTLEEAGAEIDHYQSDGATALLLAAEHGRTATVKALLKLGAQVDPTSFGGFTPLMSASRNGHTAIVKALLKHRADVHNALVDGRTALAFARMLGHIDTVQVLLSAGAGEKLRMMQD